MKLQIDTIAKTIKIDEDVKLGDLIKTLESLLLNDKWKEFKIEANANILKWVDPIPMPYIPWQPTYPYQPYTAPLSPPSNPPFWEVTCDSGNNLKKGTFNFLITK